MQDIDTYLPESRLYFRKFVKARYKTMHTLMVSSKVGHGTGYSDYYRSNEVVDHSRNIFHIIEEEFSNVDIPGDISSPKLLVEKWCRFYHFLKEKDSLFREIQSQKYENNQLPSPFYDVLNLHCDVINMLETIFLMDELDRYKNPVIRKVRRNQTRHLKLKTKKEAGSDDSKSLIDHIKTGSGKLTLIGIIVAIFICVVTLYFTVFRESSHEKSVHKEQVSFVDNDVSFVVQSVVNEVFSDLLAGINSIKAGNRNAIFYSSDYYDNRDKYKKFINSNLESGYYIKKYSKYPALWKEQHYKLANDLIQQRTIYCIDNIESKAENIRIDALHDSDEKKMQYIIATYQSEIKPLITE